jgi:hypothetical protein
VSTYPLKVVDESAVATVLGCSSALAADARLTTPTAARPSVHLLNFILVPPMLLVPFCFYMHWLVNTVYPCTKMMHSPANLGKSRQFDNKFFASFIGRIGSDYVLGYRFRALITHFSDDNRS